MGLFGDRTRDGPDRVNPDCPKCGCSVTTKKYRMGPDYLEVRCGDCGFKWTEKPLDQREGSS